MRALAQLQRRNGIYDGPDYEFDHDLWEIERGSTTNDIARSPSQTIVWQDAFDENHMIYFPEPKSRTREVFFPVVDGNWNWS